MPAYQVRHADAPPLLESAWNHPLWEQADTAAVDWAHPAGGPHRPATQARLLHSRDGLHLFFRVEDRRVIARCTQLNQQVCRDSCVEFFVEPPGNRGYFNFEFNCGGVMLLFHITDPAIEDGRFRDMRVVPVALAETVRIHTPLKAPVVPEVAGPLVWTLQAFIPFSLFEAMIGPVTPANGSVWRGNFYKCGSDTPHYLCWSPIENELNFHQPHYFGPLQFTPNGTVS